MKQATEISEPKHRMNFPVVFEVLIWCLYVTLFKYTYYLSTLSLNISREENFPYPSLAIYAIISTLYIIPVYRYIAPYLLGKKKYGWLGIIALLYLAYISKLNYLLVSYLFLTLNRVEELTPFYSGRFSEAMEQIQYLYKGWNLQMLLIDFMAFGSVAFVRYAFISEQKRAESEERRHQLEKDNLALQLNMLKTQLQPHFLFNTLNSMYGLSLSGSKDTPRFILLLSEMMQYILYETDKEFQDLGQEVMFLNNYFELEQKKFPTANIHFDFPMEMGHAKVPPLLFLPLIENSFKHGSHRITDDSSVSAKITVHENSIHFFIKNDIYAFPDGNKMAGGIGLPNLRKRLSLYYPDSHTFTIIEEESSFTAELVIKNEYDIQIKPLKHEDAL